MNTPDNAGHRQRLKERFLKTGIESLQDYEVLELLLTFTIPRKDTKPIAKELIRQFKTVNGVLNADPVLLNEIEGIGKQTAAFFAIIREAGTWCLKERIEKVSAITQRNDVDTYLRFHFGHKKDEFIAALFLDNGNHVLGTDIIAQGTVNQCALYPRAILEKALKFKAGSIILAHNHPGGSVNPSEADWQITERLFEIGRLLDIPLMDHIIISLDRVISLREMSRWPRK
jgi:DNA repair protein RadC